MVERGRAGRTLPFHLPVGTTQGPFDWYLIHLDYRLVLSKQSGPGFVWVSASTNGRTAAQIEYSLVRRNGRLRVRESRVDFVNGSVVRVLPGRVSEVQFRNYLQYKGVRGGKNSLRFAVETSGQAKVDRFEVKPTSGVFRTRRSPFPLKVQASMAQRPLRVGDRFRVDLTLSNRTGEPISGIELRPRFDGDSFVLHGRPARNWQRLGRPLRASFEFEARRAGMHDLRFLVDSSRNRPSASVRLAVTPGSPGRRPIEGALWATLFAPLAAGLAYLLWTGRK